MKVMRSKNGYAVGVGLLIYILWLIVYLVRKNPSAEGFYILLDNLEITVISLGIFLSLACFEDTYYAIPWILFLPFSFAHAFDAATIPPALLIDAAIVLLGILIHLFRFSVSWKKGKLLYGLIALCVCCAFGGLFVQTKYSVYQIFVGVGISAVLIFLYEFFISSKKSGSFFDLSLLMTALGIYIVMQEGAYYLSSGDLAFAFSNREMNLGWALIGNNAGLMLLFCIPFSLYVVLKQQRISLMILSEIVTLLQIAGIFISYSRGSILIIGLFSIPLMIFMLIRLFRAEKKKGWITCAVLVGFLLLFLGAILFLELIGLGVVESIERIILNGYNFLELNGRVYIYRAYLEKLKEHPIFGYGLLYSMDSPHIEDHPEAFEWAHNTFLQAAFCMGIIGLIAMIYHMYEKYCTCLRHMTLETFILFCAYLISGCYGLFDVSYFFVNYMILLLVAFIMSDEYLSALPRLRKKALPDRKTA